ncbi:MAG TPA: Flp family type IVb pilin [Verrucomicrobiae bacterium]|nr:Flp family type IVb pilin [Verrucomicrobiae bacterium]
MFRLLRALVHSDEGATLIEYALVVALIAVVCVLAVTRFGAQTANDLGSAANSV